MNDATRAEIAAIAADTRSGATALLQHALDVLDGVTADRTALESAAAELCRAQPAMAGLRTLATIARTSPDPAAALQQFRLRLVRAPHSIARHAASLVMLRRQGAPCRVVTWSASAAVETTILALAHETEVIAACAEGRPKLEGRDLATMLAGAGVPIELYTDAAIGCALPGADAVLVGADAVGPESFINKVGTRALCAAAASDGVPVYVLAGREKLLDRAQYDSLTPNSGLAAEVWELPPPGIEVRNPYFEHVPLQLASALVSDMGIRNILA